MGYDNALAQRAGEMLAAMQKRRPLVHNITNWVVTNVTANALLAAGASPVMAHAREEVADMAAIAQALVLNIGTLTTPLVEAMIIAGKKAREKGIPIVLDPVGVGATPMRTEAAERILAEVGATILRGNASEMSVLGGVGGTVKGGDAEEAAQDLEETAVEVARKFNCVVALTGKRDYVSDGGSLLAVDNGHEMLTRVTGTGCMVSALVAAFAGALDRRAGQTDRAVAAAAALAYFGLAAELAAASSSARGPGSFQVNLMDELYLMTPERLARGARLLRLK